MNTTARIESTGERNRIHMSQRTAEEVTRCGKGHWIEERKDAVEAKGLGKIRTFWLKAAGVDEDQEGTTVSGGTSPESDEGCKSSTRVLSVQKSNSDGQSTRVIDYIVDMLASFLAKIQTKRTQSRALSSNGSDLIRVQEKVIGHESIGLEQFVNVIRFPKQAGAGAQIRENADSNITPLSAEIMQQLKSVVTRISSLYRDNPFHSFDHAAHVTQAVAMLLSRIAKHDPYGLTTDPLALFSVVFSALVHDLDHTGVPNFVLAQEDKKLGEKYNKRAIAEQHSIDAAWDLLMEPQYQTLRDAIYSNVTELRFFRQVFVNCILATDIFDKELSQLRKDRWDRAFGSTKQKNIEVADDCKATILVENIIQAADVSHLMQHFQVYLKWNERLYHEMYFAYRSGRSKTDPTENWYKGELSFFDNYIIPLARKLKESDLFGIRNDEFLNYALSNRRQWEIKGPSVVKANNLKYSARWEEK